MLYMRCGLKSTVLTYGHGTGKPSDRQTNGWTLVSLNALNFGRMRIKTVIFVYLDKIKENDS